MTDHRSFPAASAAGRLSRHPQDAFRQASPADSFTRSPRRHLVLALGLLLATGCSSAGEGRGGALTAPGSVDAGAPVALDAAACRAAVRKQQGKGLKSIDTAADEKVKQVPEVPRPKKGEVHTDPIHGSCMVRVTDHANEPPERFARHDYSRRQAFNADGSRLLIYSFDGSWHLYDARTMAWVDELSGPASDAEIHWHPTDPNLLWYQDTNGVGMVIYEMNIESGRTREMGDLGDRIKAIWPEAHAASTRSEGAPSRDGRYWCFMVDDAKWQSLGLVVWDRQTDTIVGSKPTHGDRPDHVSMSPSGNRCVVSSDTEGVGTRAWSRDFKHSVELHHKSEHSDLALDAQGRDVYVSIDYQASNGDVFMVDVETGKRTTLFSTYLDGSATAAHFSGRAFKRPGWVLVSAYATDGGTQWLHEKLLAVSLEAKPKVKGIGYHHSRFNGYWTEPQATVNPDFTRVLFNSNWGSKSDMDIDNYLVVLPENALD
ncbi:MAG: WD40 repeat domain-containing protein [Lautropia sp.]|nr:WD40 repeat domain-containing protein [Lautropia sp.]